MRNRDKTRQGKGQEGADNDEVPFSLASVSKESQKALHSQRYPVVAEPMKSLRAI